MRQCWLISLLLGVMLLAISGCSRELPPRAAREPYAAAAGYPVTIHTYTSQKVPYELVVPTAPRRVVAIHQNSIETLFALGVGERIVACAGDIPPDFYSETYPYRAAFQAANYVGDKLPAVEAVLALQPDLIIGWHSTFSEKSLKPTDFWQQRGVGTYIAANSNAILPEQTIAVEEAYIRDLGRIFQRESEAAALIQAMEEEIGGVVRQTTGRAAPRVVVLEWNNQALTVYGKHQLAGDMVRRLGGVLLDPGRQISYEELLLLNPDVVFLAYMGRDGTEKVQQFLATEGLGRLACIQNRRVYAIPLTYMYASATRTTAGLKVLAAGMYPDLAQKGRR